MKTPLLVYTPRDFDEYLASVSKSARYEYKKAKRLAADVKFEEVPFNRQQVTQWMKLWEQQVVYGKHPKWQKWTTPEIFEKLGVKVFFCGAALQMLEVCGEYAYAQPVLYDKIKHPWAAKFMWFSVIEWCCNNGIKYLDLDGGNGKTWKQKLEAKDGPAYKWMYVPKYVKQHPEEAADWRVLVCSCGWRTLGSGACSRCGRPPGR